jgi:adenylate cyclase
MSTVPKLRVVEESREFESDLPARLELGRQSALPGSRDLESGPFSLRELDRDCRRLVIGWNSETDVGGKHALLELLADGRVRVTNTAMNRVLVVSDLPDPLPAQSQCVVTPPFFLSLGRRTVFVSLPSPGPAGPVSLTGKTLPPGSRSLAGLQQPFPKLDRARFDQLVNWLQTTAGVLQSAVATDDFLAQAAEALVTVIGLHSGRVLFRQGVDWTTEATHLAPGESLLAELSDSVLGQLREERHSVWLRLHQAGPPTVSLRPLQLVVAAPLLDPAGEVIGALYGEVRRGGPPTPDSEDTLRTVLVEILANAVSAGLARQRVERDRALLRQFFSPDLAERLSRDPSLIENGREAEVTVLFCDIRNFSAASERLGPARTLAWISESLSELSRCVQEEGGVLVDYVGDELMAMWGAPEEQRNHAERAVRAALAMLRVREVLSRRSEEQLGVATRIGIGVNSGPAQVGNTGSSYKFKYGPLGDTVNVASRIQSLTKYVKRPLLVSGETWKSVRGLALSRRLLKTRVVGVQQSRDLYELADRDSGQAEFFAASEAALDALEARQFAEAAQRAAALLKERPGDGPLQLLLARASQALVTDGEGFDPVWTPPCK